MFQKICFFLLLLGSFVIIPSIHAIDLGSSSDDKIIYCEGNDCGLEKWIDTVGDALNSSEIETQQSAVQFAQSIVQYILTFVSVIALLYIIYAWFRILVSGGSEDIQKSQRKNIFAVIIGILIIWLAYPIIKWIIEIVLVK